MKVYMLANEPRGMDRDYESLSFVSCRAFNDPQRLETVIFEQGAINMVEVVRKVLKSLPKNWEAKKTTIEEFKDFNTFKLDVLIGKLMTYEMDMQVDGGVEVVEKKKNVAFKASKQKEESEDDASNDESSNEEDITKLVLKEAKKYMKKSLKGKSSRRKTKIHYFRRRIRSDDDDRGKPSKKHIKCCECNKMGHYRNECPQLKKGERKDKKSIRRKLLPSLGVMMRLPQWKVKAPWRMVLQIFASWLKRITIMMRR
ncbi:hypothetical protein SLEP1_g17446 [Rubroshorea leprosula]|uniref:CCHC-type domain-containing protein n=1 Tax=Rubroshorea leprosula TaxID=152421 RepID=A0AAV5J3D9_9ROSI|nr:hypothetical protein SLEP1_g17446 [Rubroshorea leprosula]